MKYLITFNLLICYAISYGQSTKLSTFEEMYIVSAVFENAEIKPSVSLAPESMTYDKFASVKTYADLNKIIADTPFLSLRLGEATNSKDRGSINIHLSDRLGPSNKLNGEAEWGVIVKDASGTWFSFPTSEPEKMLKYFSEKNFMITDEKGTFSNMTVLDMKIENEE